VRILAIGVFLFAAIGSAITPPAHADWRGGGVRDRIEHQRSLIERGISSGDLTEREARSLWRAHREISELNDDLRQADMPREERHRIIHTKLDREERHLRELMHNDHRRYDDRREPGRHRGQENRDSGDWVGYPNRYRSER
jgi:hypothetical protein